MKRKVATAIAVAICLLVGCGAKEEQEPEPLGIEDLYPEGVIDYETASCGIDSNQPDFESKLSDGTYYVVHDGFYYPTFFYQGNFDSSSEMPSGPNPWRQYYFTLENFKEIPTFFPGDHIVFYSKSYLLDVTTWERLFYEGETFGVYDLRETMGGHYYIEINEDSVPIVKGSELSELQNLGVSQITIDRIGKEVVDERAVKNGLIRGALRGHSYDMEVYTGTYFKHVTATANVLAYSTFETYASSESITLQDKFWEVPIPEYFTDGYYRIGNQGVFRFLTMGSYSEGTEYNEPILYPTLKDNGETEPIRTYSENPKLNEFSQSSYPDRLGYVDPDGNAKPSMDDVMDSLPEAAKYKEANIMRYELWLPEGRECSLEIYSPSGEGTGSAKITTESGEVVSADFSRFDEKYLCQFEGRGEKALLEVSGFWFDYEITLTNAEIYSGQDKAQPAIEEGGA